MSDTASPLFDRVAIVGIGLIGSSVARALTHYRVARQDVCADRSPEHCAKAMELGIVERATTDLGEALDGADLVILCTPVGSFAEVGERIGPHLRPGAIVTDGG